MSAALLQEVFGVSSPHQIIGKFFSFKCQHGSHTRELVGQIEAYEISDESPLSLTVSNRHFWGQELFSIKYGHNKKWYAYVNASPRDQNLFEGTLTLL
jgi:hypothetical protein